MRATRLILAPTLTGVLLVMGGCASTRGSATGPTGESAESDSCSVSMFRDYARNASSASASPSEAIAAWLALAQATSAKNIAGYSDPKDRAVIADRATLDALNWMSKLVEGTTVAVDEASGGRAAHVAGSDAAGHAFRVTLSSGEGDEPVMWYVTGYEIDLDESWCPLLPDRKE